MLRNIEGTRIRLRALEESDATENYMGWMNDPEVNQYLESRFQPATLESLRHFIRTCNDDPDVYLFGIFDRETGHHIGNIKLGPVNHSHKRGDLGLIIGDKACWGRGYAREAIEMVSTFAFGTLRLHKVAAGMYTLNQGSHHAFLRAGFSLEGVQKDHFLYNGRYVDAYFMGLLNSDD